MGGAMGKTPGGRQVDWVILHCTDSDHPDQTAAVVRAWQTHRNFPGGPLKDIAYHLFIGFDGLIEPGRPLESPGAGEPGYNRNGVHVCLAGKHNFTGHQMESLESLLMVLACLFPRAQLAGHWEINRGAPKTCPNFDVLPLKELWKKYVTPEAK